MPILTEKLISDIDFMVHAFDIKQGNTKLKALGSLCKVDLHGLQTFVFDEITQDNVRGSFKRHLNDGIWL